MKKLMMMAVVAVCAIAANAASVSWQFTNTKTSKSAADAVDFGTGTWNAYILLASDVAALDFDNISEAVIADAAKGSQAVAIQTQSGANLKVGTGLTNTLVNDLSKGDYTWNIIVSNGDKYYLSGALNGTVYDETDPQATHSNPAVSLSGASAMSSAQLTSMVPEPTSGLLLLLGMAGLALKRKRA